MQKVKLGDYVRIRTGKLDANASSPNGQYPFFTCSRTSLKIDNYSYDCECVLVAGNGDLNVKYYNGKFDAYQRTYIIESLDKKKLDTRFLYCFMGKYIEELRKQTIGGIIKYIKLENLTNIQIPLPPLPEQKSIAEELDTVCDAIAKQKEQLKLCDELIKSKFNEMFGDPVINEKCWSIKKWKELFTTTTGKLDSNAMKTNGQYPFFTCAKEQFAIDKYAFDCEALILAGNNAAGIYDIKHYKGKFNAYQRTYIITFKNENVYEFFKISLEQKLERMKELSKGSNTKYLTMTILDDFSFIVPPIAFQQQFADFVNQVEQNKTAIKKSLNETETLYKALMQKYFGEGENV